MDFSLRASLRRSTTLWRTAAIASTYLVLASCQTTGSSTELAAADGQQSYGSALAGGEMSPEVKHWAKKLQASPNDINVAIEFSKVLRKEKQFDEAIGVMMRATAQIENDPRVVAELGKILVERGAPEEGMALLNQASARLSTDWTIMSAKGVAYDQMERHGEAQEAFEQALTYSPENPTVLANLGLSLAQEGRLGEAENMLRRANEHPDANSTVALNLALILGLKGDFEESERIARAHLPPATVEENMTYLRSLLSQPVRWRRPTDEDFEESSEY